MPTRAILKTAFGLEYLVGHAIMPHSEDGIMMPDWGVKLPPELDGNFVELMKLFGEVANFVTNYLTEHNLPFPESPNSGLILFEMAIRKVEKTRNLDADTREVVKTFYNYLVYHPSNSKPQEPRIEDYSTLTEYLTQVEETNRVPDFICREFLKGRDQESIAQELVNLGQYKDPEDALRVVKEVYTKKRVLIDTFYRAKKLLHDNGVPAPEDREARIKILDPIVCQVMGEIHRLPMTSSGATRFLAVILANNPKIWGSMPTGQKAE
jgi:hypothetical protein